LATVLSIFIWNAQVDGWFVVGAAMVMTAVASTPNTHPQKKQQRISEIKWMSKRI
jgi:hypothetical protein